MRASISSTAGGGYGRDITIYLTGDDPALVDRTARQVVDEMRTLKELSEPRINGDLPRPEIIIRPRLDLAAELGVSVTSISQTIRIATLGDLPQNGPKFSLSDGKFRFASAWLRVRDVIWAPWKTCRCRPLQELRCR